MPQHFISLHCTGSGLRAVALGVALSLLPAFTPAQTFDSGSTGSDGALDLSGVPPGTTVVFDPASFDPPLDPDGDSVYHFTTIQIPADVTVRLGAERLGVRPVVWLATGPVTIAGTIDLNGEDGHTPTGLSIPSRAGAGGYGGGAGGTWTQWPQKGNGPGGGEAPARGGYHPGNDFLLPLFGGSGGGGGTAYDHEQGGGGGGAGGGALLIASSHSILINGSLLADGGDGGCGPLFRDQSGGAGSGGAIRLMAPYLAGGGSLSALGGTACSGGWGQGDRGHIRLESFRHGLQVSSDPSPFFATPGLVSLPASAPAARIVRVAGTPVPGTPTGSFLSPDVTLEGVSSAVLDIEAHRIPLGTVVQITLQPETGSPVTVNSTPLDGTFELSTATATVTIPHGFSRFIVQASWTP